MFLSQLDPDHPYFSLTSQHQRNLIWSLLGPALLDCSWSPAHQPEALISRHNWQHWVQRIQTSPDFRSPRLGLMFEQIWQQYFDLTATHWQANLQVQQHNKTLGELDLLVQPAGQNTQYHLELALKFYLGFGSEWIGPNRRDYLSDKIRHTRDKQLPMVQSEAAQALLATNGWLKPTSTALMRGCLFHPAHPDIQATLPAEINPVHWRGYWLHQSDTDRLLPDSRWFLLSKPEWLSLAQVPFSVSKQYLLHHIKAHFQHLDSALCAIEVKTNQQGSWCEQKRWLIMPDNWPATST